MLLCFPFTLQRYFKFLLFGIILDKTKLFYVRSSDAIFIPPWPPSPPFGQPRFQSLFAMLLERNRNSHRLCSLASPAFKILRFMFQMAMTMTFWLRSFHFWYRCGWLGIGHSNPKWIGDDLKWCAFFFAFILFYFIFLIFLLCEKEFRNMRLAIGEWVFQKRLLWNAKCEGGWQRADGRGGCGLKWYG